MVWVCYNVSVRLSGTLLVCGRGVAAALELEYPYVLQALTNGIGES